MIYTTDFNEELFRPGIGTLPTSKIAFTRKVISRIQLAFQAVSISRQLDDRSFQNLLCGKIESSYYDSWP